jgi:hypothetical protein
MSVADILQFAGMSGDPKPGEKGAPWAISAKETAASFRRLADEIEKDDSIITLQGATLACEWKHDDFAYSTLSLRFFEWCIVKEPIS